MSESDVRQLLGEPEVPIAVQPAEGNIIKFDSMWNYDRDLTMLRLGVRFYKGRLALAFASIWYPIHHERTVFVLSEREHRETPQFAAAFCS